MEAMFVEATEFNQGISDWDVSGVTAMHSMFYYATNFNQDISNWDVSEVKDMSGMFYGALNFDQDLSEWNVARVNFWDAWAIDSGMQDYPEQWPPKFREQ